MAPLWSDAAPQPELHGGLIAEVVRRLMVKPRYAAADRDALGDLVRAQVHRGTLTIFGLVRAIERGH